MGAIPGLRQEKRKIANTESLNLRMPIHITKNPDLVLKMEEPFEIPGNNKQTYICYKIPYELPSDTFRKWYSIHSR